MIEKSYFLHVKEIRTSYPPDNLPCVRVDVIRTPDGLFDQVTLQDVRLGREEWAMVAPRGHGWHLHDDSSDKQAVYRRRHKPECASVE